MYVQICVFISLLFVFSNKPLKTIKMIFFLRKDNARFCIVCFIIWNTLKVGIFPIYPAVRMSSYIIISRRVFLGNFLALPLLNV